MDALGAFFESTKNNKAINCLLALLVLGPLPVSTMAVAERAAIDMAAARSGLKVLKRLHLATCTGNEKYSNWQLTGDMASLPIPWERLSDNGTPIAHQIALPVEAPARIGENPQSAQSGLVLLAPRIEENPQSGRPQAEDSSVIRENPQSETPIRGGVNLININPLELRQRFLKVFQICGVYPQLRGPLADALISEDGVYWLSQALGHICQAKAEAGSPGKRIGGVVYRRLEKRAECDPEFVPPVGMDFNLALAWALRAGAPEPEPVVVSEPADEPEPVRPALVILSAEEQVWQVARQQLALEMPKATFDTWLREASLINMAGDVFTIGVPTLYQKDWLENRLLGTIKRTVSGVVGRSIEIHFVNVSNRA